MKGAQFNNTYSNVKSTLDIVPGRSHHCLVSTELHFIDKAATAVIDYYTPLNHPAGYYVAMRPIGKCERVTPPLRVYFGTDVSMYSTEGLLFVLQSQALRLINRFNPESKPQIVGTVNHYDYRELWD
jgi:hypothetical protein